MTGQLSRTNPLNSGIFRPNPHPKSPTPRRRHRHRSPLPSAAIGKEMEPGPPHRAEASPERKGPSAPGDVVDAYTAARPRTAAGTGSESTQVDNTGILSKVDAREVAAEAAGGHQEGISTDAEAAVAEAAARLHITEPMIESFMPIKDVKGMLQTGSFEGQRIIYRNRKEKKDMLDGIIRGAAYFYLCGDCHQNGKELSAKAFEQHALKGQGHESHNPNHHILLSSSRISLYDACKQVKEATNSAMLEDTFKKILQNDADDMGKTSDGSLLNLEKRILSMERKMENLDKIQSQVDTLEKNVEFLVNETVRYQELLQDLSKLIGKFAGM
ncbi:unnamed protein product [Urochloa humidicola]